jgi:uncharacterized LabA/DUF88 family protein
MIGTARRMHILVDYDNLPSALRSTGPLAIADRIQSRLITSFPSYFTGNIRFEVRFYGGWHTRSAPSARGARLLSEVQQSFPRIIRMPATGQIVTINASVAESLLALPHQLLPHTYRIRAESPRSASAKSARTLNCLNNGCPADALVSLFDTGRCPTVSCNRGIEEMLSRSEQKLVDTMLVADTIFLANSSEPQIALVSSDDDMWPGMLTAMNIGTMVFHVTTKAHSNAALYTGSARRKYRTLGVQ